MDMFLSRQPKETIIQKVGQQLRINVQFQIEDGQPTPTPTLMTLMALSEAGTFSKRALPTTRTSTI